MASERSLPSTAQAKWKCLFNTYTIRIRSFAGRVSKTGTHSGPVCSPTHKTCDHLDFLHGSLFVFLLGVESKASWTQVRKHATNAGSTTLKHRPAGERRSHASKTKEIRACVHRPAVDAPHLRSELATSLTSAIQSCCQRCSNRQRKSQRQHRQQHSPSCAPACLTCYLARMRANTSHSWWLNPWLSELVINERNRSVQLLARRFQNRYSRQQQISPPTTITMSPFTQVPSCLPPECCNALRHALANPLENGDVGSLSTLRDVLELTLRPNEVVERFISLGEMRFDDAHIRMSACHIHSRARTKGTD